VLQRQSVDRVQLADQTDELGGFFIRATKLALATHYARHHQTNPRR